MVCFLKLYLLIFQLLPDNILPIIVTKNMTIKKYKQNDIDENIIIRVFISLEIFELVSERRKYLLSGKKVPSGRISEGVIGLELCAR